MATISLILPAMLLVLTAFTLTLQSALAAYLLAKLVQTNQLASPVLATTIFSGLTVSTRVLMARQSLMEQSVNTAAHHARHANLQTALHVPRATQQLISMVTLVSVHVLGQLLLIILLISASLV